MTAYWTDFLDTSTSINYSPGYTSNAVAYSGIPRQSLNDFENYASYTQSGFYHNSIELANRSYQFVLDRRGRISVSKDPLGNITTYRRKVDYESGADLVGIDRGEVVSITGPDPDLEFISPTDGVPMANGPLPRPITTFEYVSDTPFVRSTTLPSLGGEPLQTESTGYISGQFQYYTTGQLKAVRDPSGLMSTYQYDSWGRLALKSVWSDDNTLIRSNTTTYQRAEHLANDEHKIGPNVGWRVTNITSDAQGNILAAERNYLDRDGRTRQQDVLLKQDHQTGVFGGQDQIASSFFQFNADGTLASMTDAQQQVSG